MSRVRTGLALAAYFVLMGGLFVMGNGGWW